ncbi:MAG: Fe-S cluster assembly ATPase SufC [Actinomycetota bacterium]
MSHVLEIKGLRAGVAGKEILKGIDLTVRSGEVHALMGPNGSGKSTLSHVIMGRPGYEVLGGSVTLDGVDILSLAAHERAQAGLYLAMQYPTEVPGVPVLDVLQAAFEASGRDASGVAALITEEAQRIGFDDRFLLRAMNVDLSGGEKKRNETLQLGVLRPAIAILDELDSGLDVDALRACSRRIEQATNETGLGVLAITHYSRLLHELRPDHVHVLARGAIQLSGGPELAQELESTGYAAFGEDSAVAISPNGNGDDPLTDPFADPLA